MAKTGQTSDAKTDFTQRRCKPCEGGVEPFTAAQIKQILPALSGWEYLDGWLERTFKYADYYQTMAFVNMVAWLSHMENHHPDMEVGYNKVRIRYKTHAINGLSENDFICASKINKMLLL
ncbi:MAG TPA: 4a-hydroxytetrahydrobiopterin dehydratase [Phycisphaerae bacterium]|nr:4a-hydroxytetrahydrobiopterin dehydratase [Phycisphaerae bacterium]